MQTGAVTSLVQAFEQQESLSALLHYIAAEGVMDIDPEKETSYIASDGRTARANAAEPSNRRWAILGEGEAVVGYLSGRYPGRIPGHARRPGEVGAFVSIVAISGASRGQGHAWMAVQQFADRAQADAGATTIGLRLDEVGDIQQRRARFARMGFAFSGLIGTANVADLIPKRSPAGDLM